MSSRSMPFMGGVMLLTLENEDTPGFKLEHGECCPHSNTGQSRSEHLARRLMAFAVSLKAEAK
jgi:hypothetical protein